MQVSRMTPDDEPKLIEFIKAGNYKCGWTLKPDEEYARTLARRSDDVMSNFVKTVDQYGKICGIAMSGSVVYVPGHATYWRSIIGPGSSEIIMLAEIKRLGGPLAIMMIGGDNRDDEVKQYQALGFVHSAHYGCMVLKN